MSEKERVCAQPRLNIVNEERSKAAHCQELAEVLVLQLASLLRGTEAVWRPSHDSALHPWVKGNIVIELDDDDCFVLQVKCNEVEAEEYFALSVSGYQEEPFLNTSVVVTEGKSAWDLLKELSKHSGLPIKDDILKAIEMVKKLKGVGYNQLPECAAKASTLSNLVRLGILKIKKGRLYIT